MASRRRDEWQEDYEAYTENQIERVLEFCGVEVVSDTHTHFLAYCPFHGNTDSPALAVDKVKGLWTCFNPSCLSSGTITELPRRLKGLNPFETLRLINKYKNSSVTPFEERLKAVLAEAPEFVEFSQQKLDMLKDNFKGSRGEAYLKSRGFIDETLDFFDAGFSEKQNMVIIPMHDPSGMPVGLIGRTPSNRPEDKRFKNSNNLPKRLTAWNFHRAKKHGDTVIICEASYDAMRIHQAGYPNVIALLGGHVSEHHIAQISRSFSKIIIMTDFDKKQYRPNCRACANIKFNYGEVPCKGHRPGRDLGRSIADKLPGKKILWAAYNDVCVFPTWPLEGVRSGPAKDASDMTDDEIRQCLRHAVSEIEYYHWGIEETEIV